MTLYEQWLNAKTEEKAAQDARRAIEDELLKAWGNPTDEGIKSFTEDGFKVKVTFRNNRSVDASVLKEIAAENGLEAHLDALFRWKAEINKKNWCDAAEEITKPFSAAVTVKPGRPSFSVEKIEENK